MKTEMQGRFFAMLRLSAAINRRGVPTLFGGRPKPATEAETPLRRRPDSLCVSLDRLFEYASPNSFDVLGRRTKIVVRIERLRDIYRFGNRPVIQYTMTERECTLKYLRALKRQARAWYASEAPC